MSISGWNIEIYKEVVFVTYIACAAIMLFMSALNLQTYARTRDRVVLNRAILAGLTFTLAANTALPIKMRYDSLNITVVYLNTVLAFYFYHVCMYSDFEMKRELPLNALSVLLAIVAFTLAGDTLAYSIYGDSTLFTQMIERSPIAIYGNSFHYNVNVFLKVLVGIGGPVSVLLFFRYVIVMNQGRGMDILVLTGILFSILVMGNDFLVNIEAHPLLVPMACFANVFGITRLTLNSQTRVVELFLEREKDLRKSYERYFPAAYTKLLGVDSVREIEDGSSALVNDVSIMFTDINQFSAKTEAMDATELIQYVQSYFSRTVSGISVTHAIIDKFIGDSIMAIFVDEPEQAIVDALEITRRDPDTRVGIGFGDLVVGAVGYGSDHNLTTFGDSVNEAARLCDFVKAVGAQIICSGRYAERIDIEKYQLFYLGRHEMRGKKKQIQVYECLAADSPSKRKIYEEHREEIVGLVTAFDSQDHDLCLRLIEAMSEREQVWHLPIVRFLHRKCMS